jgi:hypothetical protein
LVLVDALGDFFDGEVVVGAEAADPFAWGEGLVGWGWWDVGFLASLSPV